jgi:hypothetical protein
MPKSLEPDDDREPRDLGEITLDRLLGTSSPITLGGASPARQAPPLPFWTRAYLRMLGVSASSDDSPERSWRDHLVDSLFVATLVVLLVWIGYLTFRAFTFLMHR